MNLNKSLEIYNQNYDYKKMKEWSDNTKTKYNYTCQHCGKENLTGRQCHSHHIMDKKIYPEYMYDIDCGICLCSSCHTILHKTGKQYCKGYHCSEDTKRKMSKVFLQINKTTGEIVNEFKSLTEASKLTGINCGNICSCCTGRQKTSGNYIWKYKI